MSSTLNAVLFSNNNFVAVGVGGVVVVSSDGLQWLASSADTSSTLEPSLAPVLRLYHPNVDEIVLPQRPSPADIAAVRARASAGDLLVIGSISAHLQPEQAEMVNELLTLDIPAVTVAMRTPYDLTVYPQSNTHICTYSIQPVTLRALAAALWGAIPFEGKLPVKLKAPPAQPTYSQS